MRELPECIARNVSSLRFSIIQFVYSVCSVTGCLYTFALYLHSVKLEEGMERVTSH